jgi:hypothetical protein
LIRSSFVPPAAIQELRDLIRTRKQLVREMSQHSLRMQKTLEEANLKLGCREEPPFLLPGLDEIQKLPALHEVVHLLLERKTRAQFILTGSSARKLRRQGVNLLGGRATQKLMHPYMAAKPGTRFKLGTALRQGMLPVVWGADDPLSVLEPYNALYLHEEVQMEWQWSKESVRFAPSTADIITQTDINIAKLRRWRIGPLGGFFPGLLFLIATGAFTSFHNVQGSLERRTIGALIV